MFPRSLIPIFASFFCLSPFALAQIPAFPGAEGYGAYAKGGRGGDVYHVTNLNSSGTGSFADAIATVPSAGRTIVFDVSGHIHVNKTTLAKSNVTIAGQTAPGDGIGFRDGTFIISGDDIVIRHVRFRYGKQTAGGDCIDISSGTLSAILDQVSLQFSTDENISSFKSPPENLTMQWALNGWGLESHSCGGLWDQNHASSHHSLWAHNHTRNPKARPNGLLEWVNNVTFDWDIGFIMGDSETPASWKANVRGCYFLCPPGNLRSKALEKANLDRNGVPNFSLFLENCLHDNDGDGVLNGTNKGYGIASGSYNTSAAPFASTGSLPITIDAPLVAFKKVLSKAGALRLDVSYVGPLRDEVDAKMVSNVATQTRQHITNETALGLTNGGFGTLNSTAAPTDTDRDGMPDFYEDALTWSKTTDDHNTALASSGGVITGTTFFPTGTVAGYTRLEEYLFFKSIPHGVVLRNVSGAPTSLAVNMAKFTSGFSASPVFTTSNVVNGSVVVAGGVATFTPTLDFVGRARFDFTVTDSAGSSWTQTCAIVVTNNALPRDLKWAGDGTANIWEATGNWRRNGAVATWSGGDFATFDESGSNAPGITFANGAFTGGIVVDAAKNYTFTGGSDFLIGPLTKRGTGTLTLANTGTNNITPITLEGGTLSIATTLVGSGVALTLSSGTLAFSTDFASIGTIAVPGNVNLAPSGTRSLSGAWTGAGTANVNITGANTFSLTGNTSAFAGTFALGASTGFFRFNGALGSTAATFDLGTATADLINRNGNATISLGALTGGSGTTLSGASAAANPTTYEIGGNGNSTTFAGAITDGTGTTAITKVGAGALTLTGTTSYTGATLVSAGDFIANATLGASAITVASGAKLRGAGSIAGAVTMQAGSQLSPGAASGAVGTLTLGGGLALANMTTSMQLSGSPGGANDKVHLTSGSLDLTGALAFTFTLTDGVLGAGEYFLVDGATTSSASGVTFSSNLPTSGTRQMFAISRPAAGSNPSFIKLTVTGDPATLTWTGATNGTWNGTDVNWIGGSPNTFFNYDAVVFDDTAANRSVTLASSVAPRSVLVNTALGYTLGGASLDGSGALTKSGVGTLTLATTTANAFSGGLVLNAGIIVLANDAANAGGLGTGLVTLNGGVISMHDDSGSYNDFNANLVVPAGATARLNADSRVDVYGSLTGAGTLNFFVPFVRTDIFADWSTFSGVLNVITDASGGDFRIAQSYSWPGLALASVNLADKVYFYYTGTSNGGEGTTIEIGELSGTSLSALRGGVTGGRNFTYRIGAKTLAGNEVAFAGNIAEQNSGVTTSYVKTGAGIWKLSGLGAWNGGTTIEQGTLKISGIVTCGGATDVATGASLSLTGGALTCDAVNIASGAIFTGSGNARVTGDLNNDGTATFTAGTFTVTGDVVNNGTMRFHSGTQLAASGAFTNNGLVDLLASLSALPANFTNNGIVIENTDRRILSAAKAGADFACTVFGYLGHTYQLQRADTLAGSWVSIGGALAGAGLMLTFTDTGGAVGSARFYRVNVGP